MEPLHHGELRPECFMSPQWLSQRGAKHCLRDCRDTPDPSWPRGGNRSCAMSLYQLCSFDLIFSRPLMGASEIPPFLLFCLCCQSCSKFLPSSVLSPLCIPFLASTCAKKFLLLKPWRLSLFHKVSSSSSPALMSSKIWKCKSTCCLLWHSMERSKRAENQGEESSVFSSLVLGITEDNWSDL